MAEVGEGNLNWPAILQACKSSGVEHLLVEQDICYRDPFESLEISRRNLKAMGAGMTGSAVICRPSFVRLRPVM